MLCTFVEVLIQMHVNYRCLIFTSSKVFNLQWTCFQYMFILFCIYFSFKFSASGSQPLHFFYREYFCAHTVLLQPLWLYNIHGPIGISN